MLTKGVIGNRAAEETEMTATFTHACHLAEIAAASPVGGIMGRIATDSAANCNALTESITICF